MYLRGSGERRREKQIMEYETKISVIIPVYNTEQYIWDCVKSVLEQTFTYFELILIDDGSQDNSRKICEKVVQRISV